MLDFAVYVPKVSYFAGAFISNPTWISRRIIRNLKADLIISARIVPKHARLFEGKNKFSEDLCWSFPAVFPILKSQLQILHFADGGAMNFQRDFEICIFDLWTTFALTCSFFDRRFTWNDRLFTSAGIPSAKFWLGIFDSCHFRQSHWSVQYLGGVFEIHNGWMQAFPSLLSPSPSLHFLRSPHFSRG